ncbi:PPOX class F420-dependent oxidoreductase [Gordonia sp. zg691]|uniref:PPOX class F420-dependent oxidoreductase n=1 Tax=Gordonia jinghuaiqii TaxID=2758710 RepID=A0A7D7LQF0_9ACTN|nr:PPOX class F420-dependent oxidoreductase [Gordonia jinghuaiqii]MBD0860984.1 PPOX class F420-dependent oxidoreductase [Gordonia jinghuaiqii]MCR5979457.1 TIGR03618 family F420-dependent PPOX class oxidoreductase [Gordonia jinghuaiqii]MCR5979879.1 TIGR03618 family F420-dependent PPOX class oxidoreductase [Gordonia jinghuaiqii]QMT00740.1 PPOX class F420-dependent oxidoreductase [Gordonia jinghuaiqii]
MSATSLSDPAVREFLAAGTRTGHLGFLASDGRPLVAPIWFVLDGDRIAFNTGATTAKGRALLRDPRVTLSVDLPGPPFGFVQVQGRAHITEDLDEVRRIAALCGGRYMGADRAAEFGARNGVPGELGVWIEPDKVIASLDVTA